MTSYEPVRLGFYSVEPENYEMVKAPIIFLHGITASKEHWKDIPKTVANATKRKVYVVDARNHGDSEWTDVFNFDYNVDDLLHFMDSHDIPKAVIIGHSMGGLTGMKMALRSPERVEILVVEDITIRRVTQQSVDYVISMMSLSKAALQEIPQNATEDEAKKFIVEFIRKGFPPEMRKLTSKRSAQDFQLLLKRGTDGRFAFKTNIDVLLKSLKDPKGLMTEASGVFESPAYFIYGVLSPFLVGSDEPNTRKSFPNAEFIAIEDAGHVVHTDCPKEYTEALIKCLTKE